MERLLKVAEAAELLGVSVSYLNKSRLTGDGPAYIKLGARVAYEPQALSAWVAARKRTSTER
jgi:predicted DNA-binding transcriptional regulator AlpA